MAHSFRNNDSDNHGKNHYRGKHLRDQNPALAEAMSAVPVQQATAIPQEELWGSLMNLWNGVLGDYRFYGIEASLRMYHPRKKEKEPYPMLFVTYVANNHEIGDILFDALQEGRGEFSISLNDLRRRPDHVEWWAPTEDLLRGKRALAYFLHGKQMIIDVATKWWQTKEEADALEREKQKREKVEDLRISSIRKGLRNDFVLVTEDNSTQFIRYTPWLRFYLLDEETGEAIYLKTDGPKIYVEEADPGHPLVNINPVGLFINRAALKQSEDATLYADMDEKELAKRAYILRQYVRSHPLVAKAVAKTLESKKVEEPVATEEQKAA